MQFISYYLHWIKSKEKKKTKMPDGGAEDLTIPTLGISKYSFFLEASKITNMMAWLQKHISEKKNYCKNKNSQRS